MSKLKTGLVKGSREKREQEEKQKQLKEKHHIADQNVLVVEKSNAVTFTIKTIGGIIRLVATICILLLALTGLCALLYPLPRYELQRVWQDIWHQVQTLL